MSRFKCGMIFVFAVSVMGLGPGAHAQTLCETIDSSVELYDSFIIDFFDSLQDNDNDGLPDHASLRLIEAVACLSPATDLYDATNNAYEANLAIFDIEPGAAILIEYRELIATLMMIGADMQANVIAVTEGMLVGNYVTVECNGGDCVPDALSGYELTEVFEVFAEDVRSATEPYTALGDLDLDGTNNVTEYNNVMDQNGFTSDFVIAATSSNLNGSETLRTPGSSGSGGGCFIATAAYGTPMAQEINVLRDARDSYLLNNTLGTAFVDTYYRLSPPVADAVAKSPVLSATIRFVLTPIVFLIKSPWLLLLALLSLCAFLGRAKVRTKPQQ